jgi:signal transduction histidine kinase
MSQSAQQNPELPSWREIYGHDTKQSLQTILFRGFKTENSEGAVVDKVGEENKEIVQKVSPEDINESDISRHNLQDVKQQLDLDEESESNFDISETLECENGSLEGDRTNREVLTGFIREADDYPAGKVEEYLYTLESLADYQSLRNPDFSLKNESVGIEFFLDGLGYGSEYGAIAKLDEEVGREVDVEAENVDLGDLSIRGNRAIGLIAENIRENVRKHGKYPIDVGIEEEKGYVEVTVEDNGSGLEDDVDESEIYQGTLGMNIIESLSQRIGDNYEFEDTEDGLRHRIRFRKA